MKSKDIDQFSLDKPTDQQMIFVPEPTPLDTSRMTHVQKLSILAMPYSPCFLEALKPLLHHPQTNLGSHSSNYAASNLSNTSPRAPQHQISEYLKEPERIDMNRRLQSSDRMDFLLEQPYHLQSSTFEFADANPKDPQRQIEMFPTKSEITKAKAFSNPMSLWEKQVHQLIRFKEEHNHCNVPLNYAKDTSLANWTKRQRRQYRLKIEGRHTTMTDERQNILEQIGFVWDSHAAAWNERWGQLRDFQRENGHCQVPKKYPKNQKLAVWVKVQRRQFKLWTKGLPSNITKERIEMLGQLNFVFNPADQYKRNREGSSSEEEMSVSSHGSA